MISYASFFLCDINIISKIQDKIVLITYTNNNYIK